MKDVLDEIVAHKRVEVQQFKEQLPEREIHRRVESVLGNPVASLRKALLASESGIISEFKRKSPSKGWIKEEGRADQIPLSYQQNGAAAISILTDEMFFGGSDAFVTEARRSGVTIPILYKNFVIDEYQLFHARLCGASAVLLIAADLSLSECRSLLRTAHELQLEVLLEMHDERELDYADLEPDVCGVNNRNLGTFVTDVQNSFRMASRLPSDACKVSESGISQPQTVRELRMAGFNGFLIGESFMKTPSPGDALKSFIEELKTHPSPPEGKTHPNPPEGREL
ncbi:MAG: indole-3-glycerol phosphate synthase TrpC [Prevotella sp.]|nr:indole-3-glycerol phosphate synthase TrpC [Prevotella sp.]